MGEKYKPVKGDRVRVVLEGEVRATNGMYTNVQNDEGEWLAEFKHELVPVEKIEPPVTIFKPGDRIRALGGGNEYTLADAGYVSHGSAGVTGRGRLMSYMDTATQRDHWTSDRYELVSLG